ncbi:MAG: antibiotic biosynthesis monooxygenase [Mycobacteriaceae bacterium]
MTTTGIPPDPSRGDPPARTATPAPATVVITQRVRPGREAEFRRWQDHVDDAAASFTGFLGTEVTPPGDSQADCSVVYRFDGTTNLKRWLDSGTRRDLLSRGADLFEQPPTQHVLIDERDDNAVTVVVSHPVAAGSEEDFIAWQHRMTEMEKTFPGFRGSDLHRPVPGIQDEWTIIYTFDSADNLNYWLDSPARHTLLAEGEGFKDFEVHRIANPYGSWFAADHRGADSGAASWKTALSVLVGLYPTVMILTLGITEIWPGAQLWASLLVGNILSVSLLTWGVMPIVTRVLRFWLEPEPHSDTRTDVLGLALSVGFLTVASVLFWLWTQVVWALP